MHPLDHILNIWRRNTEKASYNKERHKGTAFEELCQKFLAHEKVYANQLELAVPYAKWACGQGMDASEYGIDLVAKRKDADGWCAIQCKMYGEGKTLPSTEVNKFITASGKPPFTRRILIDTTGKPLTKPMQTLLTGQYIPVTHITLDHLRGSTVDWDKFVDTGEMTLREDLHELHPFQQECLEKVLKGLKEKGSRGKVLMACGTGKTLTSLRIAEDLAGSGGRVLYLVPSLALMSQTIRTWHQQSRLPLRSYAVCSDSQIGRKKTRQRSRKDEDKVQMTDIEMQIPPTTDGEKLAAYARSEHAETMTVVFATYQSSKRIHEAQAKYGLPAFDLAICDEAHHTAKKNDSAFTAIHENKMIDVDRRMYMTATPKVYKESFEEADSRTQEPDRQNEEEEGVLYSMNDTDQYGEVLFEYKFRDALRDGHLSDYRLIALGIPETEGLEAQARNQANSQTTVNAASKFIGIWRILSGTDKSKLISPKQPLRKVIAYSQTIADSKYIVQEFQNTVDNYLDACDSPGGNAPQTAIAADHIDGSMRAGKRNDLLNWLNTPENDTIHMLSNVRCLSEGVDVPDLDAVIFMHPRKSQVEVIQAVGRVMRKAEGKEIGYVLLPVVIPTTATPESVLAKDKNFAVIWQVCNAIRSHDEDFAASLNLLADGENDNRVSMILLSQWQPKRTRKRDPFGTRNGEDGGEMDTEEAQQLTINFPIAESLLAVWAKKCGTRRYWSSWAEDVSEIARVHTERITAMVERHEAAKEVFGLFLTELQDDLNAGVTKQDAIEMLAQHMVTKPVFDALLGGTRFAEQNAISRSMQLVLDTLKPEQFEEETKKLSGLYEEVASRAKQATSPVARQKIIRKLYNDFFVGAFKRTADKLGIVYTPIELVDFVLHSVDQVLQDEFGKSLGSDGVGILDPFTGTGTFLTRMIQSGLIPPEQLRKKYHSEMYASEIVLLAYYIASINIEEAYRAGVDPEEYEPFPGLALTDTFDMVDRRDEIAGVMPENSERRERQIKSDIMVIVGNPPWSKGQRSENDAAQNQSYPKLHHRIENTYATHSVATNKNSLYDSYILAIRWASDRIGERGVIGFVTNAGWLEGIAMDGMRKCLYEEFSSIYVLNLRGAILKGKIEGENVFESVASVGVSVVILAKNPDKTECTIRYHDIGESLSRGEKIEKLIDAVGVGIEWSEIIPNKHHDWLNQREEGFGKFMALGDKRNRNAETIFKNYSGGVKTNRDAWCYNYSEIALRENIRRMIRFYHAEREWIIQGNTTGSKLTPAEVTRLVDNDPTKISWTTNLKSDLRKNKDLSKEEGRITIAQYRPFTRTQMYFSRRLNERVYQMPQIFPHAEAENLLICVMGRGATTPFSCLMVRNMPSIDFVNKSQCFPLSLYEQVPGEPQIDSGNDSLPDEHGYIKKSAITESSLQSFQDKVGRTISPEDMFYYIYGVLHVPHYRARYANNLRIELPRIPLPEDEAQFWMLVQAGRELGELHVGYESVSEYPIGFAEGGWEPKDGTPSEDWFRVGNRSMQHPGKARQKDQSCIMYNDHITIKGIPLEAYDYVVNGKPAIAWVMERQRVKTDRDSQIVNDANRFAMETMKDPAYPLRLLAKVITVSMETNRIVSELKAVKFED